MIVGCGYNNETIRKIKREKESFLIINDIIPCIVRRDKNELPIFVFLAGLSEHVDTQPTIHSILFFIINNNNKKQIPI